MKICLLGIGNVLMGDDALGPTILETLQARYELPPEATVFDGGTPGLDLTIFLDGYDALIAVDAVKAKGEPGTVRCWRGTELFKAPLPVVMSPHEPTLREALMRLQIMGRCPTDVLLVGAIPAVIETGASLSAAVRAAIPEVEAQILRELRRLSAPARLRPVPRIPDLWWERSAPCALESPAGS